MNDRITATYRLQLTPGFTLFDAAAVAPYLHELGISDLYLSPVLEARSGSVHGYDVTDPARIRAELGGEAGFDALRRAARAAGLGIILDIVPNHMAASAENPWWRDLLEFGIDSPHARAFDLGWRSDGDQRRLILPVLGDDLAVVLGRGEIALGFDAGGLLLRYADRFFPITPAAYGPVLRAIGAARAARAFDALEPPPPLDGAPGPERRAHALAVRDGWLVELAPWADALASALDAWNARPAGERVPVLRHVAEAQTYELAFWRRSAREISYRRFFDITDLAGVRVDDGDVFRATHTRILSLVARGDVRGLRIDHVDGLRDPAQYLGRLAQAHRPRPALLVEKIVAPDEEVRAAWPVDGTTGYEFANALGGWFIDAAGWRALRRAYVRFTGADVAFGDLAYDRQRRIIEGLFGGELRVLLRSLAGLARRAGARLADAALEDALREVSACLSVYRTYITGWPVAAEDRERVDRAIAEARRRAPHVDARALAWLRSVLLLDQPPPLRAAALDFVLQWQQFTGPVMAKGFEDTALYNDFTLAAANEVGGHPDHPFIAAAELHAFLAGRAGSARAALSATSTHDTKRSEDVRLRIAALTRYAEAWTEFLDSATAHADSEDPAVPAPADRVLLYQTLIGTWPEDPADPSYEERIRAYMIKAAREAKARTSWRDPDEAYEGALGAAVRRALDPARPLYTRLDALARRVQRPAALASLAQTTIKCTAPGVPDFYQGSEDWLIALVDPDNRRPVDYEAARLGWTAIEPLLQGCDQDDFRRMLRDWRDGRIKRFITAAALRHRRACADLFAVGGYEPLPVDGPGAADIVAFARTLGARHSITIARRWEPARTELAAGPTVELPAAWPGAWRDVFTRRGHENRAGALDARAILDPLPCAILVPEAG